MLAYRYYVKICTIYLYKYQLKSMRAILLTFVLLFFLFDVVRMWVWLSGQANLLDFIACKVVATLAINDDTTMSLHHNKVRNKLQN